jgi:hypothetical protein
VSILIGFGYRARNGKDSAAQAILEARGKDIDVRSYSFAAELKKEYTEACREAGSAFALINAMRLTHNLPDWVQYEFGADETDPLCPFGKQRTLLQWWGTEYRRAQDPFYWVKKLRDQIQADNPTVALITDVRFPNEVLFIKTNRGYTVEVTREGFNDLLADSHPSEHALARYAWDIKVTVKDGQLEQLKTDAVELFDMILEWNVPKSVEDDYAQTAQAA